MKNGLVIADSWPIFSLAVINKLDLLNSVLIQKQEKPISY